MTYTVLSTKSGKVLARFSGCPDSAASLISINHGRPHVIGRVDSRKMAACQWRIERNFTSFAKEPFRVVAGACDYQD